MTDPKQSQLDKFKEAAREALADEDRWDDRLKKVVKVKPGPKLETPE